MSEDEEVIENFGLRRMREADRLSNKISEYMKKHEGLLFHLSDLFLLTGEKTSIEGIRSKVISILRKSECMVEYRNPEDNRDCYGYCPECFREMQKYKDEQEKKSYHMKHKLTCFGEHCNECNVKIKPTIYAHS